MNDQIIVFIRYVITAIVSYGVGKGWFTAADATNLSAVLINLAVAAVPALMALWGVIKTSKTAKVADVQAMPDMQVVTTSQATKDAVPAVTKASPSADTVTVPVPKPGA